MSKRESYNKSTSFQFFTHFRVRNKGSQQCASIRDFITPPNASTQGVLFASDALAGEYEKVRVERSLRDHQGKALRKQRVSLTQADHYPRGIQDSSGDPSRYPYRERLADTPIVIQDAVSIRTAVSLAWTLIRVLKAALTAEMTTMDMTVRESNTQQAAAAVIDCLGGCIGTEVDRHSR
ncbi:hypothetical protein P3T76_009911 [Phytophthora citrophthora]|uniref:Uncharacterized protein n=1 Tax=Phytophthora citrophthora TaxID=4793 RepID=A0AAD9LHQ3_9STRA|nr:hypothetical protein P3T76_009911 [Phytophthora citrophthora]